MLWSRRAADLPPLPLLPPLSPSLIADQTSLCPCWLLPTQSSPPSPPHQTPSTRHAAIPSCLQNHFPSIFPASFSVSVPQLLLQPFAFSHLSPSSTFPLQLILNTQLYQEPSPSRPPQVTVSCPVLSLLDCKCFSLPVLCDNAHCLE